MDEKNKKNPSLNENLTQDLNHHQPTLQPEEAKAKTFGQIKRLSKIDLITIIAAASIPGIASGGACAY